MEGPGMSLFKGAGSIHLNTSGQRIEEEEALEDQKRRNEELQNELRNRFDDFIDDDDDSVNDSSHFISINMNQSKAGRNSIKAPMNLQAELLQSDANGKELRVDNECQLHSEDRGQAVPLGMQQYNGYNENQHIPVIHTYQATDFRQRDFENEGSNEHFKHCYQTPVGGTFENLRYASEKVNDFSSNNNRQNDEQLQILFEMKAREVQRLSEELASCRRDATAAHDVLYGRLAVAEAERERAQLSLQQSQELVANSKHRIAELEHQVSSLNNKIGVLSVRNEELNAEVTATTASLMDTQRRLQAAKMNKDSVQNTDALFKAQQERYKEDTDRLEKDLIKTRNKLQEKENDYLALERKYHDLEYSKENLLIEKGSTINRLAMELEEAQNRLAAGETAELKEKISQLIVERNTARLQFKDMAGKLEATATELVDYRTKYIRLQEEQSELEAVLAELTGDENSFIQLQSNKPGRGFSAHADKVALLRNELKKSITAQKLKMEQIEKLNKILQQKDHLIETFKDAEFRLKKDAEFYKESDSKRSDEIKLLAAKFETHKSTCNSELLDTFKTRCSELEAELKSTKSELHSISSRYNSLEKKYEEISSDVTSRNSLERLSSIEITKEKDKLVYQLKDAKNQIEEFKNLYVEVCGVKDKFCKELNDLRCKDIYQDLKKEEANVEELKLLLETEKKKADKLQENLVELQKKEFEIHLKNYQDTMEATSKERENSDLKDLDIMNQCHEENEKLKILCEEQKQQLNNLKKQIEDSHNTIKNLNIEIKLQGERDRLIADLKEKAKQFEQYIMNQKTKLVNRRDVCTSPPPQSVNEVISEFIQTSMILDNKDSTPDQVNSKMEEIIRNEIAQHFAMEVRNIESRFKNRATELEEQHNSNILQLSNVLKVKTREVTSLQEVIMTERERLKDVLMEMAEYEKSSTANEKVLCDYKQNLEKCRLHISKLNSEVDNLRKQKVSTVDANVLKDQFALSLKDFEMLKDKYKALKKTALKYKEYTAEKDKHVEQEIKRIKEAYESSLKKMRQKIERLKSLEEKVNTKSLDVNEKYLNNLAYVKDGNKQQIS